MIEGPAEYVYRLRGRLRIAVPLDQLAIAAEATVGAKRIVQFESGTIAIEEHGQSIAPVLPVFKEIAADLGVSLLNSAGGARNTRQLGAEIIAVAKSREA
ncbi:hypothetical protein [Sphingomonas sp. Y38-1Y]|uniref:hypothetical protein n=1 Tax=Sphingomonas sp. Y38-1Y TaxID=3078265 RepID=UPI0028E98298|nr:hypothetical protein [Sphingomonas sp. Y38-1Y]